MDRGWYTRMGIVLAVSLGAVFALWPSVDQWLPAPRWVKETFEGRISPGLDIRGGLRLMYEVEVDEAIRDLRDRRAEELLEKLGPVVGVTYADEDAPTRDELGKVREKAKVERVDDRAIRVTFTGKGVEAVTREWLREQGLGEFRIASTAENVVNMVVREDQLEEIRATAVDQAEKTIKNRIDELQIRESTVTHHESDIIVEIPGGDDTSLVVNQIATAARAAGPLADGSYEVELTDDALVAGTGLEVAAVQNALRRLSAESALVRAGSTIRVADLDRLLEFEIFNRIRTIITQTAQLEFRVLADDNSFLSTLRGTLPEGIELSAENVSAGETAPSVMSPYLVARGENSRQQLREYVRTLDPGDGVELILGRLEEGAATEGAEAEEAWRTYTSFTGAEVTGKEVRDAYVGYDDQEGGKPVVLLSFNDKGAIAFERMTGRNVKRRMAIVLDDRVESAPVVQERIGGGNVRITLGSYRDFNAIRAEAKNLVVVLKAGALPAPIRPANEQLIGATLGADSVVRGAEGAALGIGLVLIFMLFYYQVAGIIADLLVVGNVVLLLATLAYFEATLTLPGIAGIALTVGMAVDANVLITERIREELRLGKSPRSAVDQGYARAMWSIVDAQLTTFIAGVVLFQFGTGPIKGFAVTLMIGILTSLFTGVFCSKVFLDLVVRGFKVERLRVG